MKSTLSLVAILAAASLSADIKYGINAEGLLGMPSIDADGVDAKIGFGGNVGAGARVIVAEKLSVRPAVGFEFITHGSEVSEDGFSYESTVSSKFLTLGVGVEYTVVPNLFVALTPEFDLSLGGTYEDKVSFEGESETSDGDIEDEKNPVLVGLGAGYSINEKFAVTAAYKLALTEYGEKYKLNKVAVGVRYEL